jgi:hypothetical protein
MAWKIVRGEIEGEKAGVGAGAAKWKLSPSWYWRMKLNSREALPGVEAPRDEKMLGILRVIRCWQMADGRWQMETRAH